MPRLKKRTLDNGLRIVMERDEYAQKSSFYVGIRVGSVDEDDNVSGISHFIEHLLFKSNKYRSAWEINRDMEYNGIDWDAYTTTSFTVVSETAIPSKISKAIDIAYQMIENNDYDSSEFENERNVVLSEINMYKNDFKQLMSDLSTQALFKDTPLEKPTEGRVEVISRVTKNEVEDFKSRFYVPNNMAIIITGNFNEERVMKKIERTFGKMKPKKVEHPNLFKIPIENKTDIQIRKIDNLKNGYLGISLKVPGFARDYKDAISLYLLEYILAGGFSSRLYQKLREERGIGYEINAIFENYGPVGRFFMYVEGLEKRRLDEALDVMLTEIEDIKNGNLKEDEFKGMKTLLLSRIYNKIDDINERASMFLFKEMGKYHEDYDPRKITRYIKDTKRNNVIDVVNKYFLDEYVITAVIPV